MKNAFSAHSNVFLSLFSFKRQLILLAKKEPYWGCNKLGEEVHMKLVQAQLSRPAGAVFQVLLIETVLNDVS